MRAPPIAYLKASMWRSKGLEKSGRAKAGAKYINYIIFPKAFYCSTSQIQGSYYYNNLEIGKVTQEKDLINLL